eukprot:6475452-Amphidinium_carterae.1
MFHHTLLWRPTGYSTLLGQLFTTLHAHPCAEGQPSATTCIHTFTLLSSLHTDNTPAALGKA